MASVVPAASARAALDAVMFSSTSFSTPSKALLVRPKRVSTVAFCEARTCSAVNMFNLQFQSGWLLKLSALNRAGALVMLQCSMGQSIGGWVTFARTFLLHCTILEIIL